MGVAGTTPPGEISADCGFRCSDWQRLLKWLTERRIRAKGFLEEAHSPASARLSLLQDSYCYTLICIERQRLRSST